MSKPEKKQNPYARRGLIQARVNNDEMQVILEKALVHTKGEISDFVRLACLNYKPLTKKAISK